MNINKAAYLDLGVGRYDCRGNLFFEVGGLIAGFSVATQIEFLETLQDSLLYLTDNEKAAFDTIINMLYEQKYKMAA